MSIVAAAAHLPPPKNNLSQNDLNVAAALHFYCDNVIE
jgi:hypothetical protein